MVCLGLLGVARINKQNPPLFVTIFPNMYMIHTGSIDCNRDYLGDNKIFH